jgi:hypothetical protein
MREIPLLGDERELLKNIFIFSGCILYPDNPALADEYAGVFYLSYLLSSSEPIQLDKMGLERVLNARSLKEVIKEAQRRCFRGLLVGRYILDLYALEQNGERGSKRKVDQITVDAVTHAFRKLKTKPIEAINKKNLADWLNELKASSHYWAAYVLLYGDKHTKAPAGIEFPSDEQLQEFVAYAEKFLEFGLQYQIKAADKAKLPEYLMDRTTAFAIPSQYLPSKKINKLILPTMSTGQTVEDFLKTYKADKGSIS